MDSKKYRLHTPEELQNIADNDFDRFKEVARYYYDNDFEFFESVLIPIIEKHKHNKKIISEFGNSVKIEKENKEVLNNNKMEELSSETNGEQALAENPTASKTNLKKRKKRIIIYGIIVFTLFITTILLYYFLIYNDPYQKAIRYLKNNEYELALQILSGIDSSKLKTQKVQNVLNYANGGEFFKEKNYRDALILLSKIGDEDDFYKDAQSLIKKIKTDPDIIYMKAFNDINAKEYNEALDGLQKIKPNDNYYYKAQSKIMYVRGLVEFDLGNYEEANTYFVSVDKTDEFYDDIKSKQKVIDNYFTQKSDNEAHKYYAQSLIEIADQVQDERQLYENIRTFVYIRNTYLPRLIEYRSRINNLGYWATNKSIELINFKDLILKWVNSYIEYAEHINQYGYNSNYNGDNMWSNYGYVLYPLKDKANELHSDVIKKYKEIQSQFNLN